MMLGQLDIHIYKNEVGPIPHTIYKEWIKDLNLKAKTKKF